MDSLTLPFKWHLKIADISETEIRDVIIDPFNEEKTSKGRGSCTFKITWPGFHKESTLNVQPFSKDIHRTLLSDDCTDFTPVVAFECRGLKPIAWNYKEDFFSCVSSTGQVFEDISLEQGDWYGFDEKSCLPVSISNLEFKFE